MTDLPTSILATRKRVDKYVPHLKTRLGGADVTVIIDEEPMEGTWPTYKRGLETFLRNYPNETHLLLMHEDMYPCLEFISTIKSLIALKPYNVLGFFQPNVRYVNGAREKGTHWMTTYTTWIQTIVWPVEIIWSFLEWDAKYFNYLDWGDTGEDQHTDAFWKDMNVEVWHALPSLVDHLGFNDSSLGIPAFVFGVPRIPAWYIGGEVSGLSVDWAATANNPHKIPKVMGKSRQFILREPADVTYELGAA